MYKQAIDTLTTLTQALDNHLSKIHRISYLRSGNEESDVSYSDLKKRALGILFNLQKNGINTGDQLIIHTDNNEFFLDAFWAGLYGGIIPVPVATASNDEHRHKLLRIFNKLESPWLYTDSKTLAQLQKFCSDNNLLEDAARLEKKCILIDSIEDISQQGDIYNAKPDDIAFIQFSSGSTSEPKGVVLTHKNIVINICDMIEGANMSQDDIIFSWMPLTHDMGMIGCHLMAMMLGIDLTIMDTNAFVRRPLLWLTAASERKSTILCSPNFGYKHFLKVFDSKGIDDIDLSNIRLIFNGAEPISKTLCVQFLNSLAPYGLKSSAMYPVYGLAEASLAVSFPIPETELESITLTRNKLAVGDVVEEGSDDAMEFVLVGKPVSHCNVRITDMNDLSLDENTVGKIQLKGDNVTQGYYRADDINKQLITEDGWLDTGDLGAFVNGHMIITGRIKDIIFINGLNFYSHDLENILHHLDQLELGKVVATGARKPDATADELIIFILYRGDIEAFIPLVKTINKTVNEKTGAEVNYVIPVKRIPKTTSGKIQRHLLNNEYLAGDYDTVLEQINTALNQATSPVDDTDKGSVERKILNICKTTVVDKTIGLDDNLFEIGISSLSLAEIHEQIEELFPGKVDISDLFDNPSVRELSTFINTTQQ